MTISSRNVIIPVLLVSSLHGVLLFLSGELARLGGLGTGVWLLLKVWSLPHRVSYSSDLKLAAVLVVAALLSTAVFEVICGIARSANATTRTCASFGLGDAFGSGIFSFALVSGLIWVAVRFRLGRNIREQEKNA
jgi:hypothetical protein